MKKLLLVLLGVSLANLSFGDANVQGWLILQKIQNISNKTIDVQIVGEPHNTTDACSHGNNITEIKPGETRTVSDCTMLQGSNTGGITPHELVPLIKVYDSTSAQLLTTSSVDSEDYLGSFQGQCAGEFSVHIGLTNENYKDPSPDTIGVNYFQCKSYARLVVGNYDQNKSGIKVFVTATDHSY